MAEHIVDLKTWPRAQQYQLFRNFERPHYATTARIDVTDLMVRLKPEGVSPYRASLYAILKVLHAVPELRMRFRQDVVIQHDTIQASMTVPTRDGGFVFGYLAFEPDFPTFDRQAKRTIEETARTPDLKPNSPSADAVAYLSCMPWLDYTSLNNAMPDADDCIPRISWGKIVERGGVFDMAMTIEVHHALVDGAHVGAFFAEVQRALNSLCN